MNITLYEKKSFSRKTQTQTFKSFFSRKKLSPLNPLNKGKLNFKFCYFQLEIPRDIPDQLKAAGLTKKITSSSSSSPSSSSSFLLKVHLIQILFSNLNFIVWAIEPLLMEHSVLKDLLLLHKCYCSKRPNLLE